MGREAAGQPRSSRLHCLPRSDSAYRCDEWEPALRDAIVDAQSLAVLWSAKAATSKWVIREQEAFRQMMHVDAREGEI